ncbi:quercetin 2,3-dioxygenase [Pyxidicoccus fallax]|uniref:Cupin domain-containing protein n=2 Tax=Pyxidicoccus fallax TaxID=394095 RepID=A0A848L6K7_9BACT|nr:cupin domain-containing protein [Pyxidicoccus fallax]NPC77364.1 quercetin 2,3-dioxygenase [Pyxidicoccus fallax]
MDIQKVVPEGKLPGSAVPYFIRSGEGERYLVGGLVADLVARGNDTGELFEAAVLTGGRDANFPLHTHARTHEALLVLDGEVELWLGQEHYLLIQGDYASIPEGTPHAFSMRSHRTRLVSWSTGKEMSSLYKALGQPYAGHVQPPDAKPELSRELLKKAEASADVRFTGKAPGRGTPKRVTNGTLPGRKAPYVLASGEGERLVAGDQLFSFLGDSRTSDGRFLIVMTEGPSGPMIPAHFHEKHTETFMCLDGSMTMRVNDQTLTLSPGDFVHAPARTIHAYQLNSHYTRFVGLLTPGLFEPFFRTLGDPYTAYVYPRTPPPFRFDRVLSKLDQLDLKLIAPPAPAK